MYLYLKQHRSTGLKYLGVTNQDDPHQYEGSGQHWKSHIKVHGDNVDTTILMEGDKETIGAEGLRLSLLWDIVESKEFANKTEERGQGGDTGYRRPTGVYTHSEETKKKIARHGAENAMYGKTGDQNPFYGKKHSAATKKKLSENAQGFTGTVNDEFRAKCSEAAKLRWKKRREQSL